jgi:hypothetical protein
MSACVQRGRVDRHFDGEISPDSERSLRQHLPACDACRSRYDRWLLLSRIDPTVLKSEVRLAKGLGLRGRASSVLSFAWKGAGLLAAAAAVALFVHGRSQPGALDGFAARGGPPRPPASRVFVYDVRPGEPPALASGTLRRGDELAFAYENGAAKKHLMVFGVDEHSHVYWFYPAWLAKTDDPSAIAIEHDARRHELPEAVRHDLDGTKLEIRSVFLDAPVNVSQVEAMIQADPKGPLPIPGAIEVPSSFVVSP